MSRKIRFLLAVLTISTLLVSCGGVKEATQVVEEAAPVVEEATPETEAAAEIEEVAEPAALPAIKVGDVSFSRQQLEEMDTLVADATKKDGSTVEYTGVSVTELLNLAGVDGETVVFVASDGYETELSMADLEGCADCIVAFDGDELRMVMPGLPSNAQVKGVVEIQVK